MKKKPFRFLLIALLLGIWIGNEINYRFSEIYYFIFLSFTLLSSYLLRSYNVISQCLLILSVIVLGIFQVKKVKLNPIQPPSESLQLFVKIEENYKASKKYNRYTAKILSIDSGFYQYKSNVLLHIEKDENLLFSGQKLFMKCRLNPLANAPNPHQFDYGKYLRNKGLSYVVYPKKFRIVDSKINFYARVYQHKIRLKESWKKQGLSEEAIGVFSALVLGDRSDLNYEELDEFSKAGVMHLLAISGLHVGIIFGLFWYLSFFIRSRKWRLTLCLLGIWAFAFFVGFKPSIFRATFMISIYVLALLFNRPQPGIHSLVVSAFFLLLIHPLWLWDVGFQLSYSAVFFILLFMPLWMKRFKSKYRIVNYFSGLIGVSIIAQFATTPIAIFYFNRFSGLFLLSNIYLIPLTAVLIVSGLVLSLISILGLESSIIIKVCNHLINSQFYYIEKVNLLDLAVFDSLHLTVWEVAFLLLLLYSLIVFIKSRKPFYFIGFLSMILLICAFEFMYNKNINSKFEAIFFHEYSGSVLGIRKGKSLNIYHNLEKERWQSFEKYVLKNYTINERISITKTYTLPDEFTLKINKTKIYSTTKNYNIPDSTKIIWIRNNNYPENFKDFWKYRVIIGGNNWQTAEIKKTHPDFDYTNQNASIISLND